MIRVALRSLRSSLCAALLLAAPLVCASAPASSQSPVALETRLAGDGARTRFVADLTGAVDVAVFALADPYRVIIDLPEVQFQLPTDAGQDGRGLVEAYRFGLFAPGKSRIVLDVGQPVSIDKAFVLDPVEGQPARLVVDLIKTDRESFMRNVALDTAKRVKSAAAEAKRHADERAREVPESIKPVIVLDAGHGGIDPGAMGPSGVPEKTVVMEFTKLLQEKLQETGRFEVVLTRKDDRFLSLAGRVQLAREVGAKLFVSIHADSLGGRWPKVRGASVYTLSERASDSEAEQLAAKENQADLAAGLSIAEENDEVMGILFDLAQRETKNFSIMFAKGLVGELRSAAKLNKNPHRFAGFRVLKAPDVPSVLLELGYLSNPHDEKLLLSNEWREKSTAAFVKAVDAFFGRKTAHGTF